MSKMVTIRTKDGIKDTWEVKNYTCLEFGDCTFKIYRDTASNELAAWYNSEHVISIHIIDTNEED